MPSQSVGSDFNPMEHPKETSLSLIILKSASNRIRPLLLLIWKIAASRLSACKRGPGERIFLGNDQCKM